MKLNKIFVAGLLLAALNLSCEKDDDGNPDVVPPRDRGEQQAADQEALEEFLTTHFYNSEDFEGEAGNADLMVHIDTIAGVNSNKTPIMDSPLLRTKVITRYDVDYTIYVLMAREGVGEQAKFTDSTFVTYRGELLNGNRFDGSNTPVWFDLVSTIPGFSHSLNEFKGASGFEVQEDNTIEWNNDFGVGTVFIPSGLGYFSESRPSLPAYSPLVFHVQVLGVNEADHDRDGIPSYLEDLNGDLIIESDDTDGNRIPNYADNDDDGDFTPTREEIEIEEDGNIIFTDSDDDGTPDYLDELTY